MDAKQVSIMLDGFRHFWPSFKIEPEGQFLGTVEIWRRELAEAPVEAVRAVMSKFKAQAERQFAPSLSEFLGELKNLKRKEVREHLSRERISNGQTEMFEFYEYETTGGRRVACRATAYGKALVRGQI